MAETRRKKKKIRDLERSRKEILDAAFFEILKYGFLGVTVDSILSKTSLTKGAFFHHFSSKMDLGYAVVDEVIHGLILSRWIDPLSKYENPVDGILAQMKLNIGGATDEMLKLGCPLNNLIQEMSMIDAGFQKRLSRVLNFWIDQTEEQIRLAQKNGFVKKSAHARDVALQVVMYHEGLYGLLKGVADKRAFKPLYAAFEKQLNEIRA